MAISVAGVDLSKSVFQLSLADAKHHVVDRKRLSRAQFHRFLAQTEPVRLVMEACEGRYPYDRTPPETTTQPDALDNPTPAMHPKALQGIIGVESSGSSGIAGTFKTGKHPILIVPKPPKLVSSVLALGNWALSGKKSATLPEDPLHHITGVDFVRFVGCNWSFFPGVGPHTFSSSCNISAREF